MISILPLTAIFRSQYIKILEQYIAGIVYNKIFDAEKFDKDSISSEDDILIPIYDVYYSLFENNVLDADHLASDDASDNEKRIYSEFQSREEEIFSEIRGQMTSSSATAYQDLSEEMQVYESFIVDDVLIEGTEVLIKTRSIPMTRCGQNGAMTDPSV